MLTNDRYIRHTKMVNFSYTITIKVHHQSKGDTHKKKSMMFINLFIHSRSTSLNSRHENTHTKTQVVVVVAIVQAQNSHRRGRINEFEK